MDRIKDYINYLDVEKGCSGWTVRQYRYDLLNFNKWVRKGLEEILPEDIRGYMAYLKNERDYKNSSIARKLSCIKGFYKFLKRMGILEKNPSEDIQRPKIPKRVPVYLTTEEMEDIFNYLSSKRESVSGKRDYAIVKVLYHTGIRVSELANLDFSDISNSNGRFFIKVIGKGDKERLIPLHQNALEAIGYWEETRPKTLKTEAVFINLKTLKRLSTRGIEKKLRSIVKQSGIEKPITPHKLRHTFATELLNRGANLKDIQDLLGHESLATTQIYTHTDVNRLNKAVELL